MIIKYWVLNKLFIRDGLHWILKYLSVYLHFDCRPSPFPTYLAPSYISAIWIIEKGKTQSFLSSFVTTIKDNQLIPNISAKSVELLIALVWKVYENERCPALLPIFIYSKIVLGILFFVFPPAVDHLHHITSLSTFFALPSSTTHHRSMLCRHWFTTIHHNTTVWRHQLLIIFASSIKVLYVLMCFWYLQLYLWMVFSVNCNSWVVKSLEENVVTRLFMIFLGYDCKHGVGL